MSPPSVILAVMNIDYSSVNPANSALAGSIALTAMTADHGNPLVNASVGAGVGFAVGVGARIKQGIEARKSRNQHLNESIQNSRS